MFRIPLLILGLTCVGYVGAECKEGDSLTRAERAVLDKHNELRALHVDTEPLCYGMSGADVNFTAQAWADSMAAAKKMKHSGGRYGETLAYKAMSGTLPWKKTALERWTQSWYNEIEDWNFETSKKSPGTVTGSFTQLVWKNSKQLNCGFATFKKNNLNAYYVVCQYFPAGNWKGEYEDNVAPLIVIDDSSDDSVDDSIDDSTDDNTDEQIIDVNDEDPDDEIDDGSNYEIEEKEPEEKPERFEEEEAGQVVEDRDNSSDTLRVCLTLAMSVVIFAMV